MSKLTDSGTLDDHLKKHLPHDGKWRHVQFNIRIEADGKLAAQELPQYPPELLTDSESLRERWLELVDKYFPRLKRHARGQAINMTDDLVRLIEAEIQKRQDALLDELELAKKALASVVWEEGGRVVVTKETLQELPRNFTLQTANHPTGAIAYRVIASKRNDKGDKL